MGLSPSISRADLTRLDSAPSLNGPTRTRLTGGSSLGPGMRTNAGKPSQQVIFFILKDQQMLLFSYSLSRRDYLIRTRQLSSVHLLIIQHLCRKRNGLIGNISLLFDQTLFWNHILFAGGVQNWSLRLKNCLFFRGILLDTVNGFSFNGLKTTLIFTQCLLFFG